jgi:hypothetical protein
MHPNLTPNYRAFCVLSRAGDSILARNHRAPAGTLETCAIAHRGNVVLFYVASSAQADHLFAVNVPGAGQRGLG